MATKKKKTKSKKSKTEIVGPVKDFDKRAEQWVDAILNAKRAKAQAERTIAEHETLLMRELGSFTQGKLPNGIFILAKKMERKSYTAPACTFIQLRIIKPESEDGDQY
jgi:hypothetical protein